MRLILPLLAALSLTGCASADQHQFYRDIQGCSREYTGAIAAGVLNGGSFTGSVHIQCDPLAVTKANAAKIKSEASAPVVASGPSS